MIEAMEFIAEAMEAAEREVEEEEATEKGDGVACVDCVETLEEDERSDEGECCKGDIVERVDAVKLLVIAHLQ